MPTYEVEEIFICDEQEGYNLPVSVEVDLSLLEPADPGISPSMGDPGEPPWPAVYQVDEVRLTVTVSCPFSEDEDVTMTITEQEFRLFIAQGDTICNDAMEWASQEDWK